jgi:hypothetical protein
VAKTLGPRSPPGLLREETGLYRLDEDPERVVCETLQLDAAGACLFSPRFPPIALNRDSPSLASSPFPYPYRVIGMVMMAFVGGGHVRQNLGRVPPHSSRRSSLVSPKRQLRNATGPFLLLLRFLRSCVVRLYMHSVLNLW